MLKITIPSTEIWDDVRQEFAQTKEQSLTLEHSLVSISKWESKWHKPYLGDEQKTRDEIIDYVRCMTITSNVNPDVYNYLTVKNLQDIADYIDNSMTATKFSGPNSKQSGRMVKRKEQFITSELIYYWMISAGVPMECEKWHINRLLTLIRICNIKNSPPKKRSKSDVLRMQAELNASRRKALNSKG